MYVLANDYGCVACLGGIQGGCLRVMMVGNAKVNKRSGLVWSGLVWSGLVWSGLVFFFIFIVAHSGPQEHSFVKE